MAPFLFFHRDVPLAFDGILVAVRKVVHRIDLAAVNTPSWKTYFIIYIYMYMYVSLNIHKWHLKYLRICLSSKTDSRFTTPLQ